MFSLGSFRPGGHDFFSGGRGRDAILWDGRGSVSINLTTGRIRGATGAKTIRSIENASGSFGDDTLIGNGIDNNLEGSQGDDHIEGRGGDDLLSGGTGTDFLDGARGTGRCDFGEAVLNCEP